MILNVWTVTAFFLAGVGTLLAVAAAVVAGRCLFGLRGDPDRSRLDAIEDQAHLLWLIVGILAGVRLLAWPHFYFLLKSYVPDLAAFGVMCVFGVTRTQPALVLTLQLAKPIVLLGLGFWFLMGLVDRKSKTSVLFPAQLVLALPLAVLAALECAGELTYLLSEKIGRPITCCTQFLDTEAANLSDTWNPLSSTSAASPYVALIIYFVFNVAAIVGAAYLAKERAVRRSSLRLALSISLVLIAVLNLVVTRWAWLDAVAPRVLELPYHHCVYELLTDTPALGMAAMMAIVGNGCLFWPPLLQLLCRRCPEPVAAIGRTVYAVCAVALSTELLSVAVHLG